MTKEETLEIYNNYYLKGISTCKLAEMFGHTHKYYLYAFNKYNLPVRSNKTNSRKYNLNQNYFENIDSHEKAYWLGFIYADGYIRKNENSKKFGIALSIKDKPHLEKLNKCLMSNYPIHTYIKKPDDFCKSYVEYCRLLITSDKIYDDLIKNGVYERKTNILTKPNIKEEFYPSFILGYFDGDGSIFLNKTKYPFYSISFVGTDDILNFIHNYLQSKDITNKNINIEKRKECQIVSYIRYGGNVLVSKILDELYKYVDKELPLERKMKLYIKCKNRIFS